MKLFGLSEQRQLDYHRAIVEVAGEHPDIMVRARAALARMREERPNVAGIWDQWEDILGHPLDEVSAAVLAGDSRGGLLRAYSPLAAALSSGERNALWQRIGLRQFVRYFLDAAADFGLSIAEQAGITGIDAALLGAWGEETLPSEMTVATLDPLKQVVAIHRSAARLHPSREARRAWLRGHDPFLGASPLETLMSGGLDRIQETLMQAVQPTLTAQDLPSH